MKEIQYDYSKFKKSGRGRCPAPETDFKNKIDEDKNVIYFFYNTDGDKKECLYIGETSLTLKDRCYTHSPKEKDRPWFQEGNCVYILQLGENIDDFSRRAVEAVLIASIRPTYNKK